ncbi:MAG: hypothetical protein K6C69_04075 [Lachnospiraceae bacterium]|nr:hypothetical protein [Lachnospiraceae bacterium]
MKLLRKTVCILGMTLCLGIGYIAGSVLSDDTSDNNSNNVMDITTKEVEKVDSNSITFQDTIAIVNLDEGYSEKGIITNYGNALLKNVGVNIRVTGLQDAKNGLSNGNYSAYMVIPSSFSKNIQTINAQPISSEIIYVIAPELEGEARDRAINNIYSIYNEMSNEITQIYTATILAEYHTAQDSANTILSNDDKDLLTLLQVQGNDLVATTVIPEMTKVENTIVDFDTTTYMTTYQTTTGELKNAYDTYGLTVQGKLNQLSLQAGNIFTSTDTWSVEEKDTDRESKVQENTTEVSTEGSTESSTEASTEASTEGSTEPSTEASTEASTEGSTESSTETSTEASTENSTESSTETSTETSTEATLTLKERMEALKSENEEYASAYQLTKEDLLSAQETEFALYDQLVEEYNELYDKSTTKRKRSVQKELDKYEYLLESYRELLDKMAATEQGSAVEGIVDLNGNEVPIYTHTYSFYTENDLLTYGDALKSAYVSYYDAYYNNYYNNYYAALYAGTNSTQTPAETEGSGENQTEAPETEGSGEGQSEPAETEGSGEGQSEPAETEGSGEGQSEPAETEGSGEGQSEPAETEGSGENQTEATQTEGSGEGETEPTQTGSNTIVLVEPSLPEATTFDITVLQDEVTLKLSNLATFNSSEMLTELVNEVKTASAEKTNIIIEESERMESVMDLYDDTNEYFDTLKQDIETWKSESIAMISNQNPVEISSYISTLSSANSMLESSVKKHDAEYHAYSSKVYSATTTNIMDIRTNVETAQKASQAKLEEGLAAAKLSRTTSNETNRNLLNNLISRLPYTRLGTIENMEVYTYMSSPLSLSDVTADYVAELPKQTPTVVTSTTTTTVDSPTTATKSSPVLPWAIGGGILGVGLVGAGISFILRKKPTDEF